MIPLMNRCLTPVLPVVLRGPGLPARNRHDRRRPDRSSVPVAGVDQIPAQGIEHVFFVVCSQDHQTEETWAGGLLQSTAGVSRVPLTGEEENVEREQDAEESGQLPIDPAATPEEEVEDDGWFEPLPSKILFDLRGAETALFKQTPSVAVPVSIPSRSECYSHHARYCRVMSRISGGSRFARASSRWPRNTRYPRTRGPKRPLFAAIPQPTARAGAA